MSNFNVSFNLFGKYNDCHDWNTAEDREIEKGEISQGANAAKIKSNSR